MPAETNFKIFNEANDASTTFNDSEYQNATQRLTGVTPGMAISRMHNKMYRQWSVMCKAIADMMVAKGYSAMDDNEQQIAEDLQAIIDAAASDLGYLLRQNSTQYAVGDVAFSTSLPSYLVLKCTTAGTTAATEPSFSGATVGGTVQDGTVTWTYQSLLNDSVPLGTILSYSANASTPPPGFLYCEGQAVSRTMYPDLFALIGTTYGAGDGSTTFNLPNLVGKYPQGDTTAGTIKSAGLPNIEGNIAYGVALGISQTTFPTGTTIQNGAISTQSSSSYGASSGTNVYGIVRLNASKSNPIYGNSDTVTPPTMTCRWIIKAYDAPTPSSAQIDLSQYAADLARRLTREQTPAFNKRDIVTTSGTYTAPVTGWYKITVKGGGGGGQGGSISSSVTRGGFGGGEGGTTLAYEKMTAGQTASVVIGAGGTGGAAGGAVGASGGNSTVTVNSTTYTGGGGKGGNAGTRGGTGTIPGASGGTYDTDNSGATTFGGAGGGAGGGCASGVNGVSGGGGSGGNGQSSPTAGGNGGDGYVWFEYFDGSLN